MTEHELEERVVAVIFDGPPEGRRFAELVVALPDQRPADVFDVLRRLSVPGIGRLISSGLGNDERPRTARYTVRRSA